MRIIANRLSTSDPCNNLNFDHGEVEDYTVNIQASIPMAHEIYTATKELIVQSGLKLYPNPVIQTLTFALDKISNNDSYTIYNSTGVITMIKKIVAKAE